jgi:cytochrome c551/c552
MAGVAGVASGRLAGAAALAAILAAGVLGLWASTVAGAQLTEEEARSLFERLGCTACHIGDQPQRPALKWELIIELLQKVPEEYGGDLDAFAQSIEYYGGRTFESWEDLIAQMAQNVGRSPDDPEIRQLFDYFAAVAGAAPAQPPAEQPPAEEEAPAPQPEQPQPEQPAEEKRGIPFGLALAITAAIVVVVVAAIYMLTKK